MTKKIYLGSRKSIKRFVIVDDDDYEYLSQFKWHFDNHYVMRTQYLGNRKHTHIKIHREIMHTPNDLDTDHINGNVFDNRKSNLRICTTSENARNHRLLSNNKSGVTGVYWKKRDKKYEAQIRVNGKLITLGNFENIKDAAKARLDAEIKYFGSFAPIESRRKELRDVLAMMRTH